MSYYAREFAQYGRAFDDKGRPIASLRVFESREARDAYVAAGPDYEGDAGYREGILAGTARKMDGCAAPRPWLTSWGQLCGSPEECYSGNTIVVGDALYGDEVKMGNIIAYRDFLNTK